MRTVILASMRTYARRYVAALLAIIIATGFIVAINALSSAAREGSGQAVEEQYGRTDVAISDLGSPLAHDKMLRLAAKVPGIAAVATNWQTYSDFDFPSGPENISIGSVATAPSLRWQEPAAGRLPTSTGEVAISSDRAKSLDVSVGDTVVLDDRRLTVTGTIDDAVGPLKATAYVPEKTFRSMGDLGFPLDIVMTTDGDVGDLISRLEPLVEDGTVSTSGAYQRDLRLEATRGIDIFQKLIFVFAGISLFVGALVIANTFTILLAQRARDLALLRCIGAGRRQVARSVVSEGVLIGAIGSVLGIGLGYAIALVGAAITRTLSPTTPMGTPSLNLAAVAIPVLLGVAVTAAGAYLPARRAGAQSPLSALQPQDVVELRSRAGALRLVSAALLLVVGTAGLVVGATGSLPAGMLGGMLSFVGILLLTPVLVPGAIRAVGPIARRLGLAGRLAHMNSLRNPRRTAATSTALLIGVTLITSVVVGAASISDKVNTSLDVNHPIDLAASARTGAVPDSMVEQIRETDGAARVSAIGGTTAKVGQDELTVLGADREALGLVHGDAELRELGPDEIVLPASSTAIPADDTGDTVTVRIGDQARELKVQYGAGLGDAAIVTKSTLDDLGAQVETRAIWLRADDDAEPGDLTSAVTAIAQGSEVTVDGGLLERADVLKILDVVLAVTIGLLAVAVLIALIGVGNTLSLSVLERVRENSLLRALGLGRRGLRSMLAFEALLMAGVSAVLGVALGTTYAWFGVRAASSGVFRSAPSLTIPWDQIALILVVAALAGLAACVLPARRAARIAPAAGLVAD